MAESNVLSLRSRAVKMVTREPTRSRSPDPPLRRQKPEQEPAPEPSSQSNEEEESTQFWTPENVKPVESIETAPASDPEYDSQIPSSPAPDAPGREGSTPPPEIFTGVVISRSRSIPDSEASQEPETIEDRVPSRKRARSEDPEESPAPTARQEEPATGSPVVSAPEQELEPASEPFQDAPSESTDQKPATTTTTAPATAHAAAESDDDDDDDDDAAPETFASTTKHTVAYVPLTKKTKSRKKAKTTKASNTAAAAAAAATSETADVIVSETTRIRTPTPNQSNHADDPDLDLLPSPSEQLRDSETTSKLASPPSTPVPQPVTALEPSTSFIAPATTSSIIKKTPNRVSKPRKIKDLVRNGVTYRHTGSGDTSTQWLPAKVDTASKKRKESLLVRKRVQSMPAGRGRAGAGWGARKEFLFR